MIVAVSVVKNGADVIESMIRGNACIADRFLVMDNGSTDRTLEILSHLKEEGIPIEIVKDEDPAYVLPDRYMRLFHMAADKYGADLVYPVDDDEILCTNEDYIRPEDIKGHLSSLDPDNLYYVNWRNYIPTEEDDLNEINVMNRQKFCFDDEPEMATKVIIPTKLLTDDFAVVFGCHSADGSAIKNRVLLKELRLAHFPVRSPEQIASKALVGWLNNLAIPGRKEGISYHWEMMYKMVKDGGYPSVDLMQMMCTLYRQHPNDEEHLNIVLRPVVVPDSSRVIKYTTDHEVNVLRNLCNNAEQLAIKCARLEEAGEE